MKNAKVVIAVVLMVFTAIVAMGYLTFHRSDSRKDVLFDTENVVNDIRIISSGHHSVLHPAGRDSVRAFLCTALSEMGGVPEVLPYDSVPSRFGGTFDIADVYCKFEPEGKDTSESYLMLVAHLDSRFPEQTPDGIVCSYGAADDGYGLGVILELTRGALTYSGEWRQGLKILFTDAEEHELDGIRCSLQRDNRLFDNVGLAVNVEARGVKGPALLFEMSAGNARLLDFYKEFATSPYTYSLTSVIYGMMPNFTDFTYLKPLFPGYNFSVIDNLSYYHNDRDNFSNIHTESIAHYGVQLEPMVREYLTGSQYSDTEYFVSESDKIAHTVPGLGTVCMTKAENYTFNAAVLALFVLAVSGYAAFGRIRLRNVLLSACRLLAAGILAGLLSTAAVYAAARLAGVPFSFTMTRYLDADWIVAAGCIAVMTVVYLICFVRKSRRSEDFVYEHLLGAVLLILVISALMLVLTGENFYLMFPAVCALAGLLFHLLMYMNIMSLPALLLVEMTALPFLYNLYTAVTVGSLGVIAFLALIYLVIITSLMRCFLIQRR